MDGSKIKYVKCTLFLGVTIDEHLDWKVHIDNLSNKIARRNAKQTQIFSSCLYHENPLFFTYRITLTVVYCNLLWVSSHVTNIRKLQLLQKKAIYSYKHIISLHCTDRSTILYDNTFTIKRPVQISSGHIYAYSYRHFQRPQNMSSMFVRTNNIHSHKLRN